MIEFRQLLDHMSYRIPLLKPYMPTADELLPWLKKIDANRWYTNFGPLSRQLEQSLVPLVSSGNSPAEVVACANGTTAISLALKALRLPPGSRILIPTLTFVGTACAVLQAGHVPVLADIDKLSWQLTPEIAMRHHQQNIAAILPVATFGMPCDLRDWQQFNCDTGISVIIDAAGAIGNQQVTEGIIATYSLHATKSLGAGEGGFIAAHDREFLNRVRKLSNFGIELERDALVYAAGENGKLSEYHAAVALASLEKWPDNCKQRRTLALHYSQRLKSALPSLQLQPDVGLRNAPILVCVLPEGHNNREVQRRLSNLNIETRAWYCPTLDKHPAFSKYVESELDVASSISPRILGLPFYHEMQQLDIEIVVDNLALAINQDL